MKAIIFFVALSVLPFIGWCQSPSQESVDNKDGISAIPGKYAVDSISVYSADSVKTVSMTKSHPMGSMHADVILTSKSSSTVGIEFEQFQNDTRLLAFNYGDMTLVGKAGVYNLLRISEEVAGSIKGKRLILDMSSTDKTTGLTKRTMVYCTKK